MDIVSLALGLLSGGGGLLAGKLMNSNMGTAARAITGIVGGVGLSWLSSIFLGGAVADSTAGASLDIGSIASSVASGGIGGGILTFILGKVMGGKA